MNQEEILQEYLQQIENGTPLRQVLASLPAEHRDLADLLVIAAKTRTIFHPAMAESSVASQRQRVMASAANAQAPGISPARPNPARNPMPRNFRRLAPLAFAAAAMMTVTVVVVLAALAFYVSTASAAHRATLEAVAGIVETAPADDPNNWSVMSSGDQVKEGMRLRTRTDSNVTLHFFDGSRALLSGESELTLTHLNGSYSLLGGKSLQVRLRQTAGESQHQVVPLKGSSSFYEVLTPSGKAVVHGTVFNVAVETSGSARFAVSRGIVEVNQSDQQVFLTAGQATVSGPNQALLPPSFEYSVQGKINAINTNQWTVNGVKFNVDPQLASALSFTAEDWVAVRGRVLTDGSFVADRIANAELEDSIGYFTGSVDSMSPTSWVISGKTVTITANTNISAGINLNDTVKLYFDIQSDGSWLATSIQKLDQDTEEDDPTATPKASETAATMTETPATTVTGTPQPEVTETREAEETEEPENTAQPSGTPQPTVTGTIMPSETPAVSATPEVTATPEGTRSGCEAEDHVNHKGEELAARWGVTYKEIIAWFCQGFGFGEIDLAYELARDSGKPVGDIFAMKAGGKGWGLIKQSVKKQQQPTLQSGTPQPSMTPDPKNKEDDQDDSNGNKNGKNNNGKNNNGKNDNGKNNNGKNNNGKKD
jgi:hypothetical protein